MCVCVTRLLIIHLVTVWAGKPSLCDEALSLIQLCIWSSYCHCQPFISCFALLKYWVIYLFVAGLLTFSWKRRGHWMSVLILLARLIRKKLFWFNVKFWYFCQGIVPLGFCDIQCIAELGHVHALQITGSELSVCYITLHPISLIGLSDCVCLFSESRLLLIVLQIRSWWYFEQDVGRWYCFLLALTVWCFDFINKDLVMCVSFSAFLTLLV